MAGVMSNGAPPAPNLAAFEFPVRPKGRIDSTSLEGLRGVASVWIMVFHCVIYSAYPVDLQGSSIMPLFFVLSGFSMQLAYGKDASDMTVWCSSAYKSFVQNRFARTYPTYLATMLFAAPLWYLGYYGTGSMSVFAESLVASTLLISTAVAFQLGGPPIDGPGWTVCTLFFFWLYFPRSAKNARSMSASELAHGVVGHFWWQAVLVLGIFFLTLPLFGWGGAFSLATMLPWTRYPCFLMGVYAGELCLRTTDSALLWPQAVFWFFPLWGSGNSARWLPQDKTRSADKSYWAEIADVSSLVLLVITALTIGVDSYFYFARGFGGLGGLWLQAFAPFLQLTVVVALARDSDPRGRAGRFLRHPRLLWLGQLSMSLYLVHHPVIYYVVWLHNCLGSRGLCGPITVPTSTHCSDDHNAGTPAYEKCKHEVHGYLRAETVPMWAVPVVCAVAVPLAFLLFWYVEEPGRRALRAKASGPPRPAAAVAAPSAPVEAEVEAGGYSPLLPDDENLSVK